MEKNCIEEFPTNKNFRSVNFAYNEHNLYELNLDIEEEQEKNEFDYMGENEEENIKDIEIAQCILGKRGNEHMDFIANFIMTYIKDIISKINTKICKICLSLSLDNNLLNNISDNTKVKEFLNLTKSNIGKIFNVTQ